MAEENVVDVTTETTDETSGTKSYETAHRTAVTTSDGATGVTTFQDTTDKLTFADTTDELTSTTETYVEEEKYPVIRSCPKDFLKLEGRHIKAEDFEWARSPVPPLANIVVETAADIESSNLQIFLKNATDEQKLRILELLPLDLPLQVTLSILDDGIYWKRLCLQSWPAWDVWRYSDNWKSMFTHRSVQELMENFDPGKDDIQELRKNIEVFSKYVTSLKMCKLVKVTTRKNEIDVHSENFDQLLDDIVSSRQSPIYLDFETLFECFPHLKSLTISLSPTCIDFENFHFNNADFNCLLRAIEKLKELKKLRLSNRNFSNEQISKFLQMLLTQKLLRELNLSFNFIDDCSCYVIAKLLISNSSIENLNLMHNKITDKGAITIASALYSGLNLEKLDLSLNMVGDNAAVVIAEVLLKNYHLTDLDLSKNKITEVGGIAFAELVNKSRTLRSLKLQENLLGEKAGKLLAHAVKENEYLLELDVRFCGFRQEDEGSIHQAILQNRSKEPYEGYKKTEKDVYASDFLF